MIKSSKIRRPQAAPMRPSRIRREPFRQPEQKKVVPRTREQEILLGLTGVGLFAIAMAAATAGVSAITSQDDGPVVSAGQFGSCDGIGNCVFDGQTIRISGDTVKIAGMVAPQIQSAACPQEQQRGIESLAQLRQLLNSGKVSTAGNVTEPNGEVRRAVMVDGKDVGAAMVNAHFARPPGDSPPDWCDG